MNLAVPALVIVLATAANAATQIEGEPLSLDKAVATTLENHPSLRSAELGVDLASTRVTEARGSRLPTVRVSETITRGNNPVFVFGSLLEQARFGIQDFTLSALNHPESITNFRTTISASVPVFDGLKRQARVAQAKAGQHQADFHRSFAEQRVRFEVIGAYYGVLVAEATRDVATQALRIAESDLQRSRDRIEAGLAVQSDVLAAQVQLAEFKQQQIQAEGAVATAVATLNVVMGVSIGHRYRSTTLLTAKQFVLPTQDDLVQTALRRRPDYLGAIAMVDSSAQGIVERRSEYLPELNAFADFGTSGQTVGSGSADYAVGATMTFALFDSGRRARMDRSYIERSLAETERSRLEDQIRLETIRAYHAYRGAEQQLVVAEAALAQAVEMLRIIRDRYEEGLTTITDLLRAETALVRAQMNVVAARHGYHIGYAAVLLSTGELTNVQPFGP